MCVRLRTVQDFVPDDPHIPCNTTIPPSQGTQTPTKARKFSLPTKKVLGILG